MSYVIAVICLIFALALVFYFFVRYRIKVKEAPFSDVPEGGGRRLVPPKKRFPMEKKDIIPLLVITAAYAAVAFIGLGDHTGPESWCRFQGSGSYADVELSEETAVSRIQYYTVIHTGNYYLQYSDDGVNYTDEATMPQLFDQLLKWRDASLTTPGKTTRYIRIISDAELWLGELCIYDEAGVPLDPSSMTYSRGTATLFDEQDTVPERSTYMNSSYFDEIYHVRTAVENIEGVYPYELSHPPLGKLIIASGIELLGLNPFGWRFMGTLFGVLMLLLMYVFIKNLFGSTAVAACGTAIFAFDFMHFVQTRIATIDTYGVFFIILMYLFMYRYITAPRGKNDSKWRAYLPLFLCGLSFGLGCACKWIVIYGGAGLAVIWLLFRISRYRQLRAEDRRAEHRKELLLDLCQCLVYFIILPCCIYYLSYIPYGSAKGYSLFSREYLDMVLDNQKFMFTYHSGVNAVHPYSSRWYQWIVDGRPILYYLDSTEAGMRSSFGAFLNPLVCWGGLLAMLTMVWRVFRYRDGKALFILLGYLSNLFPWVFITRITFEYHYFPSLIFLVLAICHVFNTIRLGDNHWRRTVYTATAACLAVFVLFYPVLTGVSVPEWYSNMLGWIPGAWPF